MSHGNILNYLFIATLTSPVSYARTADFEPKEGQLNLISLSAPNRLSVSLTVAAHENCQTTRIGPNSRKPVTPFCAKR